MGRLYILTEERMRENGRKLASNVGSRVEDLLQDLWSARSVAAKAIPTVRSQRVTSANRT
jgi:hypothetical protein